MKMEKQKAYCKEKKIPMFAPLSGICWHCKRELTDTDRHHITSCPACNWSYCD